MSRPLRAILTGLLLPASLYAVAYYALTYPLLHSFNTRFFCGQEDGYQNIWNLWWLDKSVAGLHQLPWNTTWLHHPAGTSLVGHSLAPFNAAIAVPMLRLGFSLCQAYNAVVVFSFVMAGVTTFWLARRVTGSYGGALFAGAAFTFCHFHFAHAQNHLQVVSIEWLPLAILAVYELLTGPTLWKAAGAAGAVLLVAMVDFHLTFYVVLAGVVLGVFVLVRLRRAGFAGAGRYGWPVALFVILTLSTTGWLAGALLYVNRVDPLQQNHDPAIWSTDLVDPLIPGQQWRFNEWTKPVWAATPDADFVYVEHSLYVGWVVALLCAWAFQRRRQVWLADARYWWAVLAVFFLFSLGPWLHVGGTVTKAPGVYWLLERVVPPLKMGGVPMRMMAVVFLVAAVIAAAGLGDVLRGGRRAVWVVPLLLLVWVFETLPKAQPTTPAVYPRWVHVLRELPPGAVIDTTLFPDMSLHLYYATGHGKPVGEGYVSRYPKSVEDARGRFRKLVESGDFETLRDRFGFRYLVTRTVPGKPQPPLDEEGEPYNPPFKLLYEEVPDGPRIYDLTNPRASS